MTTKDDLIRENHELRSKLELAEKWMAREVAASLQKIRETTVKKSQRKHFENAFEGEKLDIITRKITSLYGSLLDHAPKYTLERLIDAEIYWETLQRYPHMDGLPIVLAYQKILDAWIEDGLVAPWREHNRILPLLGGVRGGTPPYKGRSWASEQLEQDLENIVRKHYTLSIGRLYQILSLVRWGDILPPLLRDFVDFSKSHESALFGVLLSDAFFFPFSELIDLEIFSKKRHEKKVTFRDVKITRENVWVLLQRVLVRLI